MCDMGYRRVTTADGTTLSVRESGPPDAPVILCVHGFPDDGSLWDRVRAQLDADYRVVAYDVRGAGESDHPKRRSAYTVERLAADMKAVVDEVSPDRPVHLVAHDWGSCQSWYALTQPDAPRVRSFVSLSGPDLDHASRWIKAHLRTGVGRWQAAHSAYIGFFRMPWLPVLFIRLGLFGLLLRTDRSRRGVRSRRADAVSGLEIYRSNIGRRRPVDADRRVGVPVMVIAPRADSYISVELQSDVADLAPDLRVAVVDGGHWLPLSRPEVVARQVRGFIERLDETTVSA